MVCWWFLSFWYSMVSGWVHVVLGMDSCAQGLFTGFPTRHFSMRLLPLFFQGEMASEVFLHISSLYSASVGLHVGISHIHDETPR